MSSIYHKSISHPNPKNRVSSDIFRTQQKIFIETRFLAIQRENSTCTNPRNRVSSWISRTQPRFVAETRFLATQRLKLERPNPVAGWGRVYVDYL